VCLEIPITTVHRATCDAVKFVCLFCCLVEAHLLSLLLAAVPLLCAPAILTFRSVVRYPFFIFLAQDNRNGNDIEMVVHIIMSVATFMILSNDIFELALL
jgi:hypothetical protein